MTVLLVLFTLITFLVVDHFVQKTRSRPVPVRRPISMRAQLPPQFPIYVPEGVELASNHTWIRTNKDGTVTIGLDELLSRLVGVIETISIPRSGEMIVPTFADFSVGVKGRSLRLSPAVAGGVVESNPDVLRDPSLILSDPYGKGWLVRVKSRAEDVVAAKQYIVSRPAEWLKDQVACVRDFIAMNIQQGEMVSMQEGGLPVDGVLAQFDEEVWKDFNRSFTVLHKTKGPDRKENRI